MACITGVVRKKAFPLSQVYSLLEPGPVVMLTTAREGNKDVMTLAWYTMMEFEPPLVGCVISSDDLTFEVLKATRECVIAIPPAGLAEKVVLVGSTSGRDTDKFVSIGLTQGEASLVKAPLIDECFANLECRVVDTTLVDKYNFFVLEVVKAWIDPLQKDPKTIHHRGKGVFAVDGKIIKVASKMK